MTTEDDLLSAIRAYVSTVSLPGLPFRVAEICNRLAVDGVEWAAARIEADGRDSAVAVLRRSDEERWIGVALGTMLDDVDMPDELRTCLPFA